MGLIRRNLAVPPPLAANLYFCVLWEMRARAAATYFAEDQRRSTLLSLLDLTARNQKWAPYGAVWRFVAGEYGFGCEFHARP
jgi:hypothetical protein